MKKVILWIFLAFLGIQLIPIDRTNSPVKPDQDFIKILNTPPKIVDLMKKACYDCHTNETVYPKYAYVAPVSWSVKHHINEGREHSNFSVWGTYNSEIKQSILENTIETIRERKMPLPGYIAQHQEANLTEAERKLLMTYFEEILKGKNY